MEELSAKFIGYSINRLEMNKIENNITNTEFEVKVENYNNSENKNLHKILMILNVISIDRKIYLEIEGYFELNNGFDKESKEFFLKVNAPQILYPYARMIISQMSSLDSEKNIVLPILNFANIIEN